MTAVIAASREAEWSIADRNRCATSIGVRPVNAAVTAAAGACGAEAQQPARDDWQGMLMCRQQLCAAACCAGNTHSPHDSSITPIRRMATDARAVILHTMLPDYHVRAILP